MPAPEEAWARLPASFRVQGMAGQWDGELERTRPTSLVVQVDGGLMCLERLSKWETVIRRIE